MSRRLTRPMIPPGRVQVLHQQRSAHAVGFVQAAEQLHRQGALGFALQGYKRVMFSLGPRFLEHPAGRRAAFLSALAAYQLRLYEDAVMLMELVRDGFDGVKGDWHNAEVHYNLGMIYGAARRPADAAECYRTALLLKPDFAAAENNLGNTLRELGDLEGSELCYERIMAADPADAAARYNLAHVLLLRGHLARGFRLYEERWNIPAWTIEYGRPDLTTPRLTRETPPCHVFVHQEQGLGDTLQFLRYLPALLKRGHAVTFEAPVELGAWLRVLTVDQDALFDMPGLQVITRGEPIPAHDAHIPLLSIAHLVGIEGEADIPPVWAPEIRKPAPLYTALGDTRPVIGFTWAGNPKHHADHYRSAPLADLAPLFARPNTRFVSLQVGSRAVELLNALPTLRLGEGSEICDVSAHLTDYEATAAMAQRCDAIVCVDTSIAHLGGTLGVPTYVLTSWLSEWRWQLGRTDSPWYPSVRLVRQPTLGDWGSTVQETLTLLEAL
jgi:tetratricopeptide (TPR) repeat protein